MALTLIAAFLVLFGGRAAAIPDPPFGDDDATTPVSGTFDFKDVTFGNGLTECPQAGLKNAGAKPLDRRVKDSLEQKSDTGNDIRVNQDYSCMPQDETAIDQNPNDPNNYVAGANDYRLGWGTSGFYATTDGGQHWYDGITPFPSLPSGDNLDGGGDPVTTFDRSGVVYYAQINFNRTDDTSGVWVNRSTNGGFTWTRPCVAVGTTDANAACGGPGDPRQPGDGTVAFQQDNDTSLNGSVPSYDKEWMTAGPRPDGVPANLLHPDHAHGNSVQSRGDRLGPALRDLLIVLTQRLCSDLPRATRTTRLAPSRRRCTSRVSGAFCAAGGRPANACARQPGL